VRHNNTFGSHGIFIGEMTGIILNEDNESLTRVEGGLARVAASDPGSKA